MDFALTKEQKDIQQAAEDFAKGEFDPDAALEYDQSQQFPTSIWKKAAELGFLGMPFSEEDGGQGLGLLENVLIIEAFCRRDSGIGAALALSDFGSEILRRYGSEKQRHAVLPRVAKGEGILTLAASRHGTGPLPDRACAKIMDGQYILQGDMPSVPLAGMADFLIVICRTDSNRSPSESALLIDEINGDVERGGMGETLGMRMIPMGRLRFRETMVPLENRIGKAGEGWPYLRGFIGEVGIKLGAVGIGIAWGALDRAVDYAKKRDQFGRKIIRFDAIREKLVDMFMELESARLTVYKAAWGFDTGNPDHRCALASKIVGAKAALKASHDAVQIHGAFGYMKEGHVERFYRDAKALDLFLESGYSLRDRLADEIAGKRD
jgi:alkylation response protein AidB-like acyl-CoA dehydrogenase